MQSPVVSQSPYLPPRPRKKTNWFGWIAGISLAGTLGLGFLLFVAALGSAALPSVGVVELSGPITDEGARGLLGGGSAGGARQFIEDVERAQKDPSVKSVVIRINSPGGSASASQEMFQAVRRLRETKPVIASMGDVAASGGYYVAAACDKIYANGSTLTGSIGVISQFVNYSELFNKIGLDETTIKTGKFKDSGSPTRNLTPEERALFQRLIGDVYRQFTDDVLLGRKTPTNGKLTRQKLLALADGRVFTGRQAKQNLLVDENGGLYDAIRFAAKQASISGEPSVKNLSQSGGFGSLFGVSALDGAFETLGAAFAKGVVGEIKSENQLGAPMAR